MKKTKRKWDLLLSKAKRESGIEEIINYFNQEHDLEIGVIGAEDILDFFLENIGGDIYNKGVEDSAESLRNRFEDLELDLNLLLNK